MTGDRSNLARFLTNCFCCSRVVARLSLGLFFEYPYMGNGLSIVELLSVREEVWAVVALNVCFSGESVGVDSFEKHSLELVDCQ